MTCRWNLRKSKWLHPAVYDMCNNMSMPRLKLNRLVKGDLGMGIFYKKLPISTLWVLTHWGRKTHICVTKWGHHWLRKWFVACSAPRHSLNQCWIIVYQTHVSIYLLTCNQNTTTLKKCIWKCRLRNRVHLVSASMCEDNHSCKIQFKIVNGVPLMLLWLRLYIVPLFQYISWCDTMNGFVMYNHPQN